MWLHFCHQRCCAAAPGDAAGAAGQAAPARRARPFTVDVHAHVLTPAVEARVAGMPAVMAQPEAMRRAMGDASVRHNQQVMLPAAFPKLTRIDVRLAEMDAMGVDVQLISPAPNQYHYWADEALAAEIVQLQNVNIAALCAAHPTRLAGLGTLALQHPALAVAQLEHAVTVLRLKGVEISTSVNGLELDDPSLDAFWARAEALGAVVFIHPFGTTLGDRIATHYLNNIIGQPLETTLALSRLIFSGLLDRHPALKLIAAHGGGYLPTSIGRSNHGYAVRPEAQTMQHAPADYLRRIFFDSIVHDPLALRQLIDRAGISQVLAGTDYPYDMGHYQPHALLEAVPGLSASEQAQVLGGNAARLLGLAATV